MRFVKHYIAILLGFTVYPLFSQSTSITNSVINEYTRVDSIFSLNVNDIDTVKVSEIPAGLIEGDIVLIHHVKGATIDSDGIGNHKDGLDKSGIYSIFKVETIQPGPKYIILNYSFQFQDDWEIFRFPYMEGEVAQLITVPRYEYATLNTELTADAWDPVKGYGGVCALWVDRTLTLNFDINVSGKGFKGADPLNRVYTGDSSVVSPTLYEDYFYDTVPVNRAGLKGEGITSAAFDKLRGRGRNITGGGGGNGMFSGGGGGSNGSPGGQGGREIAWSPIETGGLGGHDINGKGFYSNTDQYYKNRIFLGGGGGAGTQIPADGFNATRGGNGGGIVIILADSIIGNNHSIIADGESVSSVATAGAGGGGAGGVIMVHSNYIDCGSGFSLSAVGGDGGWTRDNTGTAESDTTGPGGGGGGGAYWLYDSIVDNACISRIHTNSSPGEHTESNQKMGAGTGSSPLIVDGLNIQLRGFLFNSITGDRTICSDVIPPVISGSQPQGGNTPFTYKWMRKIKDGPWEEMIGETGKSLIFSTPLPDTTSYRRIAISAPPIVTDTSFITTYYVHPAITGNTIVADDKICAGESTGLLDTKTGNTLEHGLGEGTYTFRWRKRGTASDEWNDAAGEEFITDPTFEENLNDTAYYKRVVNSGACYDTSNVITIEVLPQFDNNLITEDQIICFEDVPDAIEGPKPTGGDQDSIYYQWEYDSGPTGSFVSYPLGDANDQIISPPALSDTTIYRRVVTSGTNRIGNNVCSDTSNVVDVIVLPLITNNMITSQNQVVCQGLDADQITASIVGGGDNSYSYWWEASSDQLSWRVVGNTDLVHSPGLMDSTSTWFRRTVGSGGSVDSVCIDNSVAVEVRVIDSIAGNTISTDDSIMCQHDSEPPITGGSLSGGGPLAGGGTFDFLWEKMREDNPGVWAPVTPTNDQEHFSGGDLIDTSDDLWFRRTVYSGPDSVCIDVSTGQKIRVQAYPSWNSIDLVDELCVNTELALDGTPDQGEPDAPTFVWSQIEPVHVTIDSSDNATSTTTLLQDKVSYIFTRAVYKGECEDISDADTVYINPRPVAAILNQAQEEACEYDSTQVTPNPDNRHFVLLSFDQNEGEAPFIVSLNEDAVALEEKVLTAYEDSILVDPLTDDFSSYTYTLFSVTDANGCEAYEGGMSGEVEVTVYATPDVQIMTEIAVCPETPLPPDDPDPTVQLIADSDNGTWTRWRQISGPLTLEITDSTEETASVVIPELDEFAVYGFRFLSKKGIVKVCEGIADIEITVFEEPRLSEQGGEVDAGPFLVQYWNDIASLNGTTNAGAGVWTTDAEGVTIDDPNASATYARSLVLSEPPEFLTNKFLWTVTNGMCPVVSDTVTVVRYNVKQYDGFSPNDDGVNDYFIMQGLTNFEGENPTQTMFTLTIYSSVGNLVRKVTQDDEFSAMGEIEIPLESDERIVWDGLSTNGSKVPPGIYYYGLEYYTIYYNDQQVESGRITGRPQRGSIIVKGY